MHHSLPQFTRCASVIALAVVLALLLPVPCVAQTPEYDPAPKKVDPIPIQSISILNPYKNYPYNYKGQLHAHSKRSDGDYSPEDVLNSFTPDFNFVSLTDHANRVTCDQIFTDPAVPGITYVPGQELPVSGSHDKNLHLLEIGLTACPLPRSDGLRKHIAWVEATGGFAAAAHPVNRRNPFPMDDLLHIPWLRGVELQDIALWDSLLRADRVRWGICTEDTHKLATKSRWVVVFSELIYPNRLDLVSNLRQGNFYSVCAPYSWQSTHWPRFHSIENVRLSTLTATIKVKFSGTRSITFKGRDGALPCVAPSDPSGRDLCRADAAGSKYTRHENDDSHVEEVAYPLNGDEGYVRVELENSKGVRAYSQPLFIYGKSVPDCIPVNYAAARVELAWLRGTEAFLGFDIVDGQRQISRFRTRAAADSALGILKRYQTDQKCFLGRPSKSRNFEYFLSSGKAPSGPYAGEDCIPLDKSRLEIALLSNSGEPFGLSTWKIVQGSSRLWDFGDSEIQAHRAMEILGRHDFSFECFVDRPVRGESGSLPENLGMVYLRK